MPGIAKIPIHRSDEVSVQLGRDDYKVQTSIVVKANAHDIYQLLRDRQNQHRIFPALHLLQRLDDYLWLWEIYRNGTNGEVWRFMTETIESLPGRLISWRTTPQSEIFHAGSVWLLPSDDGTRIKVHLKFKPVGGRLGYWWSQFRKRDPETLVVNALENLKRQVEAQ